MQRREMDLCEDGGRWLCQKRLRVMSPYSLRCLQATTWSKVQFANPVAVCVGHDSTDKLFDLLCTQDTLFHIIPNQTNFNVLSSATANFRLLDTSGNDRCKGIIVVARLHEVAELVPDST